MVLRALKTRTKRQLEWSQWRLKNMRRIMRHRQAPLRSPAAGPLLQTLRREGIIVGSHTALLDDARVYEAASAHAHELWRHARASGPASGGAPSAYGRKDYKLSLLQMPLTVEHPFVQLALQPRLLALANAYLGMRSMLRAVELWWDRPTESPAKETQLWHRDGDDVMNVKVFVYWSDVDLQAGPFCFIPGTHPKGPQHDLAPEHDPQGRTTDEQMARAVPLDDWRICTGPAGTVVVCDTCGYHKGLKPSHHDRLILMAQYTSETPRYPKVLRIAGDGLAGLGPCQQDALEPLIGQ